ncbi:MAG: hypothetical protein ACTHJQ_27160 [Rhizobiaceae bacterium]
MARIGAASAVFRVAAQQTVAETRKLLIRTAKAKNAEVMSRDPRPATFTRYVDGKEGVPEEAVEPTGTIIYRYPRFELVVQYAMEMLFDLSPVLSGDYRNGHTLFLDGTPVSDLKTWRPGDEISISNPLPYSRKIEVGKMKMRVPGTDRVYQQARRKVMSRYGNMASVTFTYRALIGGEQINQARAASSGQPWWFGGAAPRAASGLVESRIAKVHGKTAHNRANLRFPTLVIKEL